MNNKSRFPYSPGYLKPSQTSPSRVLKACDRCRLKKTKCDGKRPCSRCEAEDTVCSFAMPKKFRNVVHPKGSVEMLLQQQEWLVSGLLELYRRTQLACGPSNELQLESKSGLPSVHHILEQLGILEENHSCVAPESSMAASPRQRICEPPGDTYKTTLYSANNDTADGHYGIFNNDNGSSYQASAPSVTGNMDQYATFFEFHGTVQKAQSALSSQHSDAGPSWDFDLTSGLDQSIGEVLSPEVQTAFEIPLPPAIYGDRGCIIPAETFHQHLSRSPLVQNTPTAKRTNSTHHVAETLTFPTSNGLGRLHR
ncbi:uncharacterized protein Z519_04351 [Cladophialophora bantiana CBS 173.52]|uniref:Zn(2)-C6 fungal-type domain-containing protein n=1 Tax=Cladophialophora bantiana (strain ATCC 10958 / CBS 173.52 / CDC B-1940 / NIH 8579) TaxID=1442370 RepID=A0A0D2HU24_CLAB1|nr:uncharacterized protein Z519_04351 [Cladophialophora bantiana CBS 173.52]KIW94375.1 hypothetical protein Z519_04351 [Cladophialophora bantiana CBS 173.52]